MELKVINNLNYENFIDIFGNVVEYYPQISLEIYKNKPYDKVDEIVLVLNNYLDQLNLAEKRKILEAHPDLSGKLDQLTNESVSEQKSAGLDKLTNSEKENLKQLNSKYRSKFGFPFVICAKENAILSILTNMTSRIKNDIQVEIQIGIEEVKKISKYRILDIVSAN